MNGAPLLPQHGSPLRLIVPGWYGMAHVKWLRGITVLTEPFDGYQNAVAYRLRQRRRRPGRAGDPDRAAGAAPPAGLPRLHVPHPGAAAGAVHGGRARLVGPRAGHRGRGHRRRRPDLGAGPAGRAGRRGWAWRRLALRVDAASRAATCWAPGPPTPPGAASRSSSRGTGAASPTTWCSGSRWWCWRSEPRPAAGPPGPGGSAAAAEPVSRRIRSLRAARCPAFRAPPR